MSPEKCPPERAGACETERHAPGQRLELARQQRCVGGDHDDDRAGSGDAAALEVSREPGAGFHRVVVGQLRPDRYAGHRELAAVAEVRLQQHADGVVGPSVPDDA